jgi:hypothetical protein
MTRYLLTLVVLIGCASADGHPPDSSPEAQPDHFTEVSDCVAPSHYLAWQSTDGLVYVSRQDAPGTFQIVTSTEQTPFTMDFDGVQLLVQDNLELCLLGESGS